MRALRQLPVVGQADHRAGEGSQPLLPLQLGLAAEPEPLMGAQVAGTHDREEAEGEGFLAVAQSGGGRGAAEDELALVVAKVAALQLWRVVLALVV